MGGLLFFVYTSTPHRHLQNNFKNEKKTMGIFMSFSVSFSYLFVRFYTNNYRKGSRILRLPLITVGFSSVVYSEFGSTPPTGPSEH